MREPRGIGSYNETGNFAPIVNGERQMKWTLGNRNTPAITCQACYRCPVYRCPCLGSLLYVKPAASVQGNLVRAVAQLTTSERVTALIR